jgi:hypothetical protein
MLNGKDLRDKANSIVSREDRVALIEGMMKQEADQGHFGAKFRKTEYTLNDFLDVIGITQQVYEQLNNTSLPTPETSKESAKSSGQCVCLKSNSTCLKALNSTKERGE